MRKRKGENTNVLVPESKYEGKYVAFDPAVGRRIIASGNSPAMVVARARKLGVEIPAIIFVPKTGMAYIY